MQTLFNPTQFTLNEEIEELMKENAELQELCTHSFENGVCKFCDKREEDK